MIRFNLLLFSLLISYSNQFEINGQCPPGWHRLAGQTICLVFGTSQGGNVGWYDAYKACQMSSAELVRLTASNQISAIEQLTMNSSEINLKTGSWIGKAKWSNSYLCEPEQTTQDDLDFDCFVLISRDDHSSICIERVSCLDRRPFICQRNLMREETATSRLTWWKCIVLVWCLIDDTKDKTKKAEIDVYKNQFVDDAPYDFEVDDHTQPGLEAQATGNASGSSRSLFIIVGSLITLLVICTFCIGLIFIYKRIKQSNRRSGRRLDSFESIYSTMSR